MKQFIVEDGRRNEVVARGLIGQDGKVKIEQSFLSKETLATVVLEIEGDIKDGVSGGRLSVAGLEWLEMFQR